VTGGYEVVEMHGTEVSPDPPGCPVIELAAPGERPVGEWIRYYSALRDAGPVYWNSNGGWWVLTRADDVRRVLQDPETFSSASISAAQPDPDWKWIPGNIDPPLHIAYRQILNRRFAPAAVASMEPAARVYARRTIDEVEARGGCDIMADVAGIFPTRVFMETVGLPWEEAPRFVRYSDTIFDGLFGINGMTQADAVGAMAEIREYFAAEMAERRRTPRDPAGDFLTHVMGSTVGGEPISDDDVLNIFNQLVLAGLDTVKSQLGYAFFHLATHPEDRRWIVREPAIIPRAVEELLRGYPLIVDGRKLARDVEFLGCPMKRGQMVQVTLLSAVRDPSVVERADEIILDRGRNAHLAFGAGPHRCLGSHLARMEMAVLLDEWHRRIPEYRLAVDPGEIVERGGQLSLRNLPVVWA
jgi:cytochrome P450